EWILAMMNGPASAGGGRCTQCGRASTVVGSVKLSESWDELLEPGDVRQILQLTLLIVAKAHDQRNSRSRQVLHVRAGGINRGRPAASVRAARLARGVVARIRQFAQRG